MTAENPYPRVLVVALGKINAHDNFNNGLFLRNLFGNDWPKDRLAQIYSSGDAEDSGFFGHYYKIGRRERFFGRLFYHVKSEVNAMPKDCSATALPSASPPGAWRQWLKSHISRLLVQSGFYELIFRPRLSAELREWIEDFRPDVILAQGYNLTFTWLPLLIKKATGARLAVLSTDDWPRYLYAGMHGEPFLFRPLMRPIVKRAARRLFREAELPLAFGEPMAVEYSQRYGRDFLSVYHADDPARFDDCAPRSHNEHDTMTIVTIGTFNEFRWPLLLDANEACATLNRQGLQVRLAVFSSAIAEEGKQALVDAEYIDTYSDPGNDDLPSYLNGANALLLIEGFDKKFTSAVELSVSSKAHLFMFSRRPIVVYAPPSAGVTKYAASHGWAAVVSSRSVNDLTAALRKVLVDESISTELVSKSQSVSHKYHTYSVNRDRIVSYFKS